MHLWSTFTCMFKLQYTLTKSKDLVKLLENFEPEIHITHTLIFLESTIGIDRGQHHYEFWIRIVYHSHINVWRQG